MSRIYQQSQDVVSPDRLWASSGLRENGGFEPDTELVIFNIKET
jgi:hypothetical protein